MPLNDGEIFAGFRIVRLLGSGGMGEVYLAQHPRLPRRNALKVLPADVSADAEYRARFNREADLASNLWHPHIVSVHDRGEYNGQLWISMDFVDGQDAASLLASRFPVGMPTDQVMRIVTAMAGALDYAHKQGLLHRDVKPANIMLTHLDDDGEQRILLADFGIARDIDDISGLTTTNMAVGTVAYSAPEQLMGEEIDGRADQYALAATVYHLLTGSQLFPHSNPAVVISRHLNAPPPPLGDIRPELSDRCSALSRALAKVPSDRFDTCSDFAQALAEFTSWQSLSTSPEALVTRPATLVPKPHSAELGADAVPARPSRVRTATVIPVVLGLMLAAALVYIGVLLAQRTEPSSLPMTTQPAAPSTATALPTQSSWAGATMIPTQPPSTMRLGETYKYDDGFAVTVSPPAPFTPSSSASIKDPGDYVVFVVTFVNGSTKNKEPGFSVTAQSGNQEAARVFDSAQGITTTSTVLLPGRELASKIVFKVDNPSDIVMAVSPGSPYYTIIFTN